MKIDLRSLERAHSFLSAIERWLAIPCPFSLVFLTGRVLTTGRLSYAFLAWNLFLAFVPYLISRQFIRQSRSGYHRLRSACLVMLWILFLPNSFYILTDL